MEFPSSEIMHETQFLADAFVSAHGLGRDFLESHFVSFVNFANRLSTIL
jgi:hypothetical protein